MLPTSDGLILSAARPPLPHRGAASNPGADRHVGFQLAARRVSYINAVVQAGRRDLSASMEPFLYSNLVGAALPSTF